MGEQKVIFKAGIVFVITLIFSFLVNIPVMGGMGLPDPVPEPVEPVITPGPLGAPIRVASYSAEALLVSDYHSGTIFKVSKIDPNDVEPLFTIEGRPLAIGYFGKNIIVGNETTGNLEVYNKNGKLTYILNKDAYIERPSDMAIDQKTEQIFIVDSRAHLVKVYAKNKLLYSFTSTHLTNPVGIALDTESQEVYVSDHGDSIQDIPAAVFIYTYDGEYIGMIGSVEFGFVRPRGLAYDQGILYITDALKGEVTAIDVQTMTKPGVFGEYGSDPGQLVQPQDVEIDEGGVNLYVANKRLGRIEKIFTGEVGQ